MKLLSMAQDWLTASAAIKATAASTELATAATIQSTSAKVQNTAATAASTAAQLASAAAFKALATDVANQANNLTGVVPKLAGAGAAATSAPMFGLLGSAVGGSMRVFAPLLALDVVLNFKSYGTAIGEWAARMAGAKDRTAELQQRRKAPLNKPRPIRLHASGKLLPQRKPLTAPLA